MTTDLELQEEMSTVLQEQFGASQSDVVDFRANVPTGTKLGEQDLGEGSHINFTKSASLVKMNGQELPARFRAYRADNGQEVWLPLVQMGYYLGKRTGEGARVFVTKRPDVAEIAPIEETCEVCQKARGGRKRNFYDYFQLVAHMENLHPSEWAAIQAKEQRAEREQDRDSQSAILLAVQAALERMAPPVAAPKSETKTCPECGEEIPTTGFQFARHMKTHKKEASDGL